MFKGEIFLPFYILSRLIFFLLLLSKKFTIETLSVSPLNIKFQLHGSQAIFIWNSCGNVFYFITKKKKKKSPNA